MNAKQMRIDWAKGDAVRDKNKHHPRAVKTLKSLSYGPYGVENELDLHLPKLHSGKLPVIFACHGGGYFYGSKELYGFYCESLAKRGFAVINFNYRLAPENKFPAPLEDANAVISWAKKHADEYNLDLNNLFILGDSAGAHLAAMLCLIYSNPSYCRLFPMIPWEEVSFNAACFNCGFFGLKESKEGVVSQFYITKDVFAKYKDAFDLASYLNQDHPPFIAATCSGDFLLLEAEPYVLSARKKDIEAVYRCYSSSRGKLPHVHHVNVGHKVADAWNDEEAAFFFAHRK